VKRLFDRSAGASSVASTIAASPLLGHISSRRTVVPQDRCCARACSEADSGPSNMQADHNPFRGKAHLDRTWRLTSTVQLAINDFQAGNTKGTCTELALLVKEAKAQSGKHLTSGQATTVINAAKQIEAVIGC
jgi:hypothetical protein